MKTRKVVSMMLALLMLVSVLFAGCGTKKETSEPSSEKPAQSEVASTPAAEDTKASGEKTEVTFWSLSTRQDAINPIIEAFNASNDKYQVTGAYFDTDGIKDACKVAVSSGTLPNMWFNWGGSLGGFYVDNGVTYDMSQYAKDHGWYDSFNRSALDLCTYGDHLAGYPTSFNVLGVYYRKDIFEKYNLAVPTTFEEFEKICATLKENGITPISTAGLNGWHVMRFVELMIEHYAGADLHDAMNFFTESYNNDAVVKALTKYEEFCDKGYFPVGFTTADPNDTNMAVFSGTAAMDIQGQWYDGMIVQNEQDMNNYGVFAFPSGGTNRLSAFAEMTQFNAKNTPEELEACVAFMDYYYSDEVVKQYAEYYNMPLPKQNAEMPEGQPNVPILMKLGETNGTFTITDQAFPTEVADVLFNVQDAIANKQTTPADGAKKIADAIDAYKSK